MTLPVKDANGASKDLETGAGDGTTTPFRSPASVALGKTDDTAASSDTGTFSVIALVKRALQNWTTLLARIPGLGQAVAGSSLPVVLPAAQITTLAAPVVTGTVELGATALAALETITVASITAAIPAGANAIGSVSVSNFPGTQAVSGTVELGATSLAALETVTVASLTGELPAGANALGSVTVSNFPATQPVSAAALPLPSGASTDATLAALANRMAESRRRRRVQNVQVFSQSGNLIPTDGTTYLYSAPIDVSDFDELLAVVTTVATTGSTTGMSMVVQTLEFSQLKWITLPGGTLSVPTGTGTNAVAALAMTNFGSLVRVGITCTAAYSTGSLGVTLQLKG